MVRKTVRENQALNYKHSYSGGTCKTKPGNPDSGVAMDTMLNFDGYGEGRRYL